MKPARLNDKGKLFIEEYLVDFHATQAAIRAGYSQRTAYSIGSRLLKKVEIRAEVDRRLADLTMSKHEVLARLTRHARGSLQDVMAMDADGQYYIDLAQCARAGKMDLIKSVTISKGRVRVEQYDAQAALALLGKHYRLFVERHELFDWRGEAIDLIRRGDLTFEALAGEFDENLAAELFESAGVPIAP
jgi:phage terminase small subunit